VVASRVRANTARIVSKSLALIVLQLHWSVAIATFSSTATLKLSAESRFYPASTVVRTFLVPVASNVILGDLKLGVKLRLLATAKSNDFSCNNGDESDIELGLAVFLSLADLERSPSSVWHATSPPNGAVAPYQLGVSSL